MTKLPFMRWWPGDFYTDPKVRSLTPDARRVYREMIDLMWMNEGWLSADDRLLARQLDMDVRTWRARYKDEIVPLLHEMSDEIGGRSFTQKRVQKEIAKALELRRQRIANLGISEEEYGGYAGFVPTKPGKKKPAQTGKPSRPSKPSAKPDAHPHTIAHSSVGEGLRPSTGEVPSPSLMGDVSALPPRDPVTALRAFPAAPDEPPSDPNLTRLLVQRGLQRTSPGSLTDVLNQIMKGESDG